MKLKASLDTNVIIHFYNAGKQNILFEFFENGIYICEFIKSTELNKHGQHIMEYVEEDIRKGKIIIYTEEMMKRSGIYSLFKGHVKSNLIIYNKEDKGEAYAISLALTIGACSLVTDDTKERGPYYSLLNFKDDEVMPFKFSELLILRYLIGECNEKELISDFNAISGCSDMNLSFRKELKDFRKRFFIEPYKVSDTEWLLSISDRNIINKKFKKLRTYMEKSNLT